MKFYIYLFCGLLLLPLAGAVHAEAQHESHASFYYQCSMHPWITSDKPGNCPVCGMKLTKVHKNNESNVTVKGRTSIEIDSDRQNLIGVTKGKAAVTPLTYSVHSVGHVAYNPDVATSLAEYREAYAAYRTTRGNSSERLRDQAMKTMELAEMKLRISGFSSEQFEQVKNASFDGRVVKNFFAPENLILPEGSVWVDTDLYETDSEAVKIGDKVLMAAPALPGKVFEGTVKTSDPLLNEFPRKLRVRIETPHADALKAGMAVDVRIMVELGSKLAVPEEAVLDSGHSKIVFVENENGRIESREVQTGHLADGHYEIIAGLHEGETIITSGAFLIDSESRLRAAAQGFTKKTQEAAPSTGHRH